VKIFAYRVHQRGPRSFEHIITRLHALALPDRYFSGPVRLEDMGRRGGFLLMDFSRERGGHGPGRMSRRAALQDIQLRGGESFGEDTGLAFDPQTGYAALQYNHYGPRVSAIEDYLYAFDESLGGLARPGPGQTPADVCGFRFGALLKRDAMRRLQRLGIIHEIDFAVSVPGAQAADLDEGRSLGQVLRAPLPEGVETISMTIKAAAGRGALGHGRAMSLIHDLLRIGAGLKQAIVKGRPTREDPLDKIDLVSERVLVEPSLTLGRSRRYSRRDRWAALSGALGNWIAAGVLQ
jgi:hypothetical protein